MKYITRDIEPYIISLSQEYACILLTGPRQVGKTTMLRHCMNNDREYVTLDDLDERRLAQTDPAMFLQMHTTPILIDEVQYAPALFSYIKIKIDEGCKPGTFWLTGSQAFHMMELAQESLAGRAAILHMSSLSQHELYGKEKNLPFSLDLEELKQRRQTGTIATVQDMYTRIWNGSMPGLQSGKYTDRDMFYSSYLQTYIGRDIRELIQRVDAYQFQDFIRAAACRAGQMLNVHSIAMDVGITDVTAKRWLAVLEQSDVIFYLRPYSNNVLKRTIKQPKLYFFDTGLVAYLTKYTTPDILENGAINGAVLENYVVAELRKTYYNAGKEPQLWYYRDKDKHEIDIVIEENGFLHPLEIKKSVSPTKDMIRSFRMLEKAEIPLGKGAILCMRSDLTALDSNTFIIPIWMI